MCAEKKGVDAEVLSATIIKVGGPTFSGTKADDVKYHDDKSLYTGVYAQGGPTNVDSVNPTTSFGSSGTSKKSTTTTTTTTTGSTGGHEEEKKSAPKKSVQAETKSEPAGSIEEVFLGFTAGAPEMEGKTFAKFAKDCKILDKALTATDIDLIFAKVKDKTARKINYAQF